MAKTNFSKVEDVLGRGLRKITVNRLLKLADVAAGIGQPLPQEQKKQRVLIATIKRELNWLYKQDKKVYKKLKIDKEKLEKQFKDPAKIADEEWKEMEEIFHQVKKFKETFYKKHPKESDESLVEAERVKHINKRFNVSEKWLPLH